MKNSAGKSDSDTVTPIPLIIGLTALVDSFPWIRRSTLLRSTSPQQFQRLFGHLDFFFFSHFYCEARELQLLPVGRSLLNRKYLHSHLSIPRIGALGSLWSLPSYVKQINKVQ